MANFYACSFDQYGPSSGAAYGGGNGEVSGWSFTNETLLGDGWANLPSYLNGNYRWTPFGTMSISVPPWGSRQGDYALVASGMDIADNEGGQSIGQSRPGSASMQLAIPGATNAVRTMHLAFGMDSLPLDRGHGYVCLFMDSNLAIRGGLRVNASGRLEIVDGTNLYGSDNSSGYTTEPLVLGASSTTVIAPNTWYSLNVRVTTNAGNSNADVEVWVGEISAGTKVIDLAAVAFTDQSLGGQPAGADNNIDIIGFLPASLSNLPSGNYDNNIRAVRDIVLTDATGSYNTGPLGQVFVSAQEMRAEAAGGWTAHSREDIGNGILNAHVNNTGIRCADAADLEIAAQDFTWESRVRISSLQTGTGAKTMLFSKWFEPSNMGYRFYYDADDSALVFEASTTGAAAIEVKNVPWSPLMDRYYDIAVVRDSSLLYFFVDGVQLGTPVTDANTYFSGTASLGIGADFADGSTPDTASVFDGYLDETRFTIGTGRYIANYTPLTVEFGRDVGGDADFGDVVLLMGYDNGSVTDESSVGRTLTLNASPVTADQPGDGDLSYKVLNQRPAWDDTYIEAGYLYAEGVLTLSANPVAAETMTIGATTYTWRASFTGAPTNEIIIGATVSDSIDNAIAAINNGAGEGTTYGTGTSANASVTAIQFLSPQMSLRAVTIGAAGNSVTTTETMASGSFGAATLEGGQDIPTDADFTLERLPIDVSGVLSVQATSRVYKTDAGSADIQFDFIGPSAGVAAGAAQSVDLNPAWARQVFEEDPDTAAGLTPSSIIGGRLRFKRTA